MLLHNFTSFTFVQIASQAAEWNLDSRNVHHVGLERPTHHWKMENETKERRKRASLYCSV